MELKYDYKILGLLNVETEISENGVSVKAPLGKQSYTWDKIEFVGLLKHQKFDYEKENSEFLEVMPPGSKAAMDLGNNYQRMIVVLREQGKRRIVYLHIPITEPTKEQILQFFAAKLSTRFTREEVDDTEVRKKFKLSIPLFTRVISIVGCYIFSAILLLAWFVVLYNWNELNPF